MDYITRLFGSLFRSSANRFKERASAQVRRNTIGKVQAKTMSGMAQFDKKLYSASDRVTNMNKKQAGGGGAANSGGGAANSGGGAANSGGGGGSMGRQQQGTAKMGKGKRNKRQKAMTVTCTNCGSGLNSDWDICPFCGTPVGQVGTPAPQPSMGGIPTPTNGEDAGAKTMALDLSALGVAAQKRTVVGWIVAQNGNHRGEDFRIYDGKNILGTAADCDIVITDPFLSAKHCTIRHENGNFQVTDLDSMNGTFVNQKRCTKSDLIDNDTIRLGRTEFKFKSLF